MLYKILQENFNGFINAISEGKIVYTLEESDECYHLTCNETWNPDKHVLGAFRPVEPLKSLLFKPRESLGSLMKPSDIPAIQEQVVIGVKNCDLSALKIHDHVFLNTEPVDPYYKEAREKTLVVSCDCSDACDVCFCPAVNEQPYPKEGFDINISTTSRGYVVETGTQRGEAALEAAKAFCAEVDDAILKERDKNREDLFTRVAEQAAEKGLKPGMDLREAVRKSLGSGLWDTIAEDCVECGACNFSCCTCHCFLLADGTTEENGMGRIRQWDSCLYLNFARVAGGANPRNHRAERLYNRFDKKFNFFPEVLDMYACDGCGRCIEACTGKIDIRDVLRKALDEV